MGQGRSALRVIGGKDAEETEYPFVVRLQNLVRFRVTNMTLRIHFCTGTLIAPTWTVTAAHCAQYPKTTSLYTIMPYLVTGTVLNAWTKFNETTKFIKKFVTHPGSLVDMFTLRNDIALIKSEAVTLSQYGRISAIDAVSLIGLEATVTGYGITNDSFLVDDATTLGKPLQTLDVLVVQCGEDIRQHVFPRLCVARRCGRSAGLCPGDSGGPLLHSSGILGVNSAGPQSLEAFCALEPTEPVYDTGIITPIDLFIDWIKSTIDHDSLSSPSEP